LPYGIFVAEPSGGGLRGTFGSCEVYGFHAGAELWQDLDLTDGGCD